MATINEILNAIKVSRDQGFSEADIATGLARYGITASQIANATASTYTPTQIENAINVSRQQGFSDADITTGLARYGVTTAQPYVDPSSGRSTGLADPSKFTSPTTYTPAQIANAINVSRQQGFSEADVATGLGRFLPNAAAVTAALAANPKASPVTPSAITPIARPPAPRQFTSTQVTPAAVTNKAITGTPYTNVYTPPTMQRNAPTLAQISAASQSANPYQSLMALTPQRTLSPAYAGMLGQTTANTNQGGFNPAIYNPAATPVTGLLDTNARGGGEGGAGYDSGGSGGGSGGQGQTGYGSLANLAGEAQRAGFTTIGNFLGGLVPVGAEYNKTDLKTGLPAKGSFTTADLAALGNKDAVAAINAQNQAIAQDVEQQSSSSPFDGGTGEGLGAGYDKFKGGLITPRNIRGPNPPGPDDGNTNIDIGEYVIRKSAVKKYGSNIFEQINAGRIPAQRLKSLLE